MVLNGRREAIIGWGESWWMQGQGLWDAAAALALGTSHPVARPDTSQVYRNVLGVQKGTPGKIWEH